jgi:predicted TPR repeat methyltransferase
MAMTEAGRKTKLRLEKQVDALYDKADGLREDGELEAAIAAFEACLALAPEHISARNDLGIAQHDIGDAEAAITTYRLVLELDPHYIRTLNNLGNALQDAGYWDEALANYEKALALEPDYIDAIYNMAVALQEQSESKRAAEAFARVLQLEPDHPTAGHMAAALSGRTTAGAPAGYIRDLFDDYARSFEADLTGELNYRTPAIIRGLLLSHIKLGQGAARILDLGCGTGLLGDELAEFAAFMVGVDLSTGMLAEAEKKQIYDELVASDIVEYLRCAQHRFEIIAAADVLVYIGDLAPLFTAAVECLTPGGYLVVSTERSDGDDYALGLSGRYAHRKAYVQASAEAAGLSLAQVQISRLREDAGVSVEGFCFLFQRN